MKGSGVSMNAIIARGQSAGRAIGSGDRVGRFTVSVKPTQLSRLSQANAIKPTQLSRFRLGLLCFPLGNTFCEFRQRTQ